MAEKAVSLDRLKRFKSKCDSRYALINHGTHVPDYCTTITDWNSATKNGWFMASGAKNSPTENAWYFGRVVAHNAKYLIQEVWQFTASSDAKAVPHYIRAQNNGTWGAWTNVTVAKAVPANAVFTDTNTTYGLASTSANGLLKQLNNSATHYMDGTGSWHSLTAAILSIAYPVGSVRISYNSTNPGTYLGGTWVQFSQGRVPIGQGTGNDGSTSMTFGANSTGGEYKHKLVEDELAKHSHIQNYAFTASGGSGTNTTIPGHPDTNKAGQYGLAKIVGGGNDVPHNNIQPWQSVYFWRRTA